MQSCSYLSHAGFPKKTLTWGLAWGCYVLGSTPAGRRRRKRERAEAQLQPQLTPWRDLDGDWPFRRDWVGLTWPDIYILASISCWHGALEGEWGQEGQGFLQGLTAEGQLKIASPTAEATSLSLKLVHVTESWWIYSEHAFFWTLVFIWFQSCSWLRNYYWENVHCVYLNYF